MKKWLFSLVFFCFSIILKAQVSDDLQPDTFLTHIPSSEATSTATIAEYVKKNFVGDLKKVGAIYSWVTSNLRYSTDSANVINLGPDPNAKITAALRRRKGVCENYAAIFNDICLKSGLTSFVIDGYTKQNGSIDRIGHAWCAVLIDNTWMLCDPTWDEGSGTNTKYFLTEPSAFIESHIPFDPMWQLLNYPISHQQFASENFYTKEKQYFNYADTIAAYLKMDSLHQLQSSAYRVEQAGLHNPLIKDRLNLLKMHIEMIRQDKDVDLYNSSVADLNEATKIYNNFVQFRNNQFTPAVTDQQLQSFLNGIDKKIAEANKKLDEIERSQATFTFSTEAERERLTTLNEKVKEQNKFLNQYLNTAKANRQSLFYKHVTAADK